MTVDEFKKAIQNNCTGKAYADFPKAFKAFIEGMFKTVDIDGTYPQRNRMASPGFNSLRMIERLLPELGTNHLSKHLLYGSFTMSPFATLSICCHTLILLHTWRPKALFCHELQVQV